MEDDKQQPNLPDLNLPPRPRPEDPGYEVVDADGNIMLPGFKSVDGGHESNEPLKSSPERSENEQAATSNSSGADLREQPDNRQPATGHATVRALILTGFGINCEEEFAAAYRLAGAEPTIVHLNQVLHGHVSIHDYDILNFPGGFSFGDDLGSGVVLANKLRYRKNEEGRTLLDDIRQFVADGRHVLGICNGFQVLVKLGLLPDLHGTATPEVTLTHNASGRYEDRWVRLKVNPQSNTPFLKGIDMLEVPVRHGEGRLVIEGADTLAAIENRGLNCLTYTDFDGSPTDGVPRQPQRGRPELRRPDGHHRPRIRPDAPPGGVFVALQPSGLGPAQAGQCFRFGRRGWAVAVPQYCGTRGLVASPPDPLSGGRGGA